MDLFSSDARVIISIISGLIGGAIGGVLTAGRIAVLGMKARERYEASAAIRGLLNSYKAQLQYDHDEVYRTDAFSPRYASIEGQDHLAESILRQISSLSRRRRRVLRDGLITLIGALPLELAEGRVHLAPDVLNTDEVRQRRVTYMLKALHHDQPDRTKGLLSELLRTQNDTAEHDALLKRTVDVLDGMLETVQA